MLRLGVAMATEGYEVNAVAVGLVRVYVVYVFGGSAADCATVSVPFPDAVAESACPYRRVRQKRHPSAPLIAAFGSVMAVVTFLGTEGLTLRFRAKISRKHFPAVAADKIDLAAFVVVVIATSQSLAPLCRALD